MNASLTALPPKRAIISDPPPPSERLHFRRWDLETDSDRLAYFRMFADPAVRQFIAPERRFQSVPDMRAMLLQDPPFDEWGFGFWIVEHRETGALIGTCGFKVREMQLPGPPYESITGVEMGCLIMQDFWAAGFGKEASAAVVAWADAADIPELWARVLIDNHPSIAVIESAGFVAVREGYCPDGIERVYRRFKRREAG